MKVEQSMKIRYQLNYRFSGHRYLHIVQSTHLIVISAIFIIEKHQQEPLVRIEPLGKRKAKTE